MDWFPLSPGQCRALSRLGKLKSTPEKLIIGYDRDEKVIVVVPASGKDRRRWDIGKGGKIERKER